MHLFLLTFGFGIVTAAVLALASVGLSLQFGVTNYVNFAYGAYLAVGMYVTYTCTVSFHLPFLLGALIGVLMSGVVAVVVDVLVLERFVKRGTTGFFLLIVTFGLQLILLNLAQAIWGVGFDRYSIAQGKPLTIGPFSVTAAQLEVIGVAIVALGLVHLLLTRSRLGKAMRAMSDNKMLAQTSGIDINATTLWTWFLTGCLAGLGGIALALNTVEFQVFTGNTFLFVIFAAVILGGIGKIYGAMLGALIIGVVVSLSSLVISSAYNVDVAFAVLVIVLLIRPQGIFAIAGKA
ncbi:branched-chain amino acid ABC transporter permease [Ferrimicrobium acidiphilum]|uniref:High-affinity branched-chain amino acid transport system permease protein LivH n=1 Tax=Ferrimicrobium acidiphilum DSM 19497 TaxID=1121877 RepID=A0A0D8FS26_9ACTN|nr:branched-chain amino acid ABC transporter permease [Ferrimicrobium acidiphilum]KJE76075.1 high-affinity branched-chain amino acid transport system permease protein LivH [Ferrimicrobium acidiphilum DSM 19497]MCL5052926.1 branched-chain amino acid ABC transporter permease [Gammaproteobacteria bacterium]